METTPLLNKLPIANANVNIGSLSPASSYGSVSMFSVIAKSQLPILPQKPTGYQNRLNYPKMACKIPTGERVVLTSCPNKRGILVDTTQVQGYCRDHDYAPKYLVKMDWNSSCWLTFIGCISYTVKFIYKYTGTKYILPFLYKYTGAKFLLSSLYKYSGLGFCVSWLFHRFIFGTWFYHWNLKLFGFFSIHLGRNKLICIQEMEEEGIYDEKEKRGTGIQGFNNSCYLDAFLFSMFYASSAFDPIFDESGDSEEKQDFTAKTKEIVRNEIRDPLRNESYVSAKQVWKLREQLKGFDSRIIGSFMAIENAVYMLFEQALNLPKFLHYSIKYPNSTDYHFDYMHIMNVDTFDPNPVITIQKSFETSMRISGNMKFCKVPNPALILSLPWQNNALFHHEAIIPTFKLNIQNLMTNPQEICSRCEENTAIWESVLSEDLQKQILLCEICMVAEGDNPSFHLPLKFVSRTTMKLAALMCYRAGHFTTFVCKSGKEGRKDEWIRFDSMSGILPRIVTADGLEKSVNSIIQEVLLTPKSTSEIQITSSHARAFGWDGHTCIYEPVTFHNSSENAMFLNNQQSQTI